MSSSELRHRRTDEQLDEDDTPMREHEEGMIYDSEENGIDKSRESKKHRSKDTKKSRKEEKDHSSKDVEKDRVFSRERRKDDRDERDKDRNKDKLREKDYDRDKYRDKEREKDKDKDRKDRVRDKDKEKDKGRERITDRGREREKDREKHKDREKNREIEKVRDADQEKDRSRDRDKANRKSRDEGHDRGKGDKLKLDGDKQRKGSHHDDAYEETAVVASGGAVLSKSEVEDRILRMKEERLKKKSESGNEISSWASKIRKLAEKRNSEKEKALQLSKVFEEQDNIVQGENEEDAIQNTAQTLAGVRVLDGLDKVIEGGAVVLTLKDQNILANGDINEDADMLENVEIGEQKRRNEAYKAAKKTSGIYTDKFNDEPGFEKKMLPQYDDPVADEGITLDAAGRFTGEAEKKLEELRRRIQGVSTNNPFQDLSSSGKVSSDYYTNEEMLQFKKPKKKKSLRKKAKLDLDALEAEAVSAGLGTGDLGSRNEGKRQAVKEAQEKSDAEMRSNAYQSAFAKADVASKALRMKQTQTRTVKFEEDENLVFDDDGDDHYKSLEIARKLALSKKDDAVPSGPQAIALLASTVGSKTIDTENSTAAEPQENKVVFTEMEEFVWGLQLDEDMQKPNNDDVFMEEDEAPKDSDSEPKDESGGWTEVNDNSKDEQQPTNEDKDVIIPDETIHEAPVGKGLSGALKLLKERGTLKESMDWGGRNMDKKKSKLVGINDGDAEREIRIERTDEFGRVMTPKESFRIISHKFHGKGPGKMKQEKRMKQFQEELKLKHMKNSDTPSLSVERMREAQARLKTPYLVLNGHVKPGQTSDPRSGFATVEKERPGELTPMLGDRKVEHFLGIKRKGEPSNLGPSKKPKP